MLARERKGDGEHRIDVETEPARHPLIVDTSAHARPKARVLKPEHQQPGDHQGSRHQKHPVDAETEVAELDAAAQVGGQLHRLLAVPNT